MAKNSNKNPLQDFITLFRKIAYKNGYDKVFPDFLDMFIKGFSPWDNFEQYNTIWQERYDKDTRLLFGELIKLFISLMNENLKSNNAWFDALGTFYEMELVSKNKQSTFGQFFTPSPIADFMAKIQGDIKGKQLLLNDPCSGSGRFVLAMHANNPGNYYFAEDIDPVCCRMTVCNMLIHGAVGAVIHHDSLNPDSFYEAWAINHILNIEGIPTIKNISQMETDKFYDDWKSKTNNICTINKPEKKLQTRDNFNEQTNRTNGTKQLKLF